VQEKLTRFARQQPKNAQANYYLAASLWKRAQRSENSAEIQQCDSLLGAAIKSDPKQDSAYILLGTVRASRADFRGAIDLYKKALKINPQSSEAHYRLSQAYKRTGQQEKAEQEVQLYKQAEKAETDAVERQRREIRQFLIILWDQAQPPPPSLE
jgi:Tfp pilus assembly protein PilF